MGRSAKKIWDMHVQLRRLRIITVITTKSVFHINSYFHAIQEIVHLPKAIHVNYHEVKRPINFRSATQITPVMVGTIMAQRH